MRMNVRRSLQWLVWGSCLAGLPIVVWGCQEPEETIEDLDAQALTETRTLAIQEDPSVLVEHPATLEALERRGFDHFA